jgi:iron complex outermembrane receptor protein
LTRTAAACLALWPCARAAAQEATALPPVVISSPASRAQVGGFGDVPLSQLPMQASVVSLDQYQDRGMQHLADLVSMKAGVSDSYNAAGYWDMLSVRGFTLDNQHNFRRDGLPINAETLIPLDNKARFEVLEGTSGMQAGLSAPGGLVNLVVKRPEGSVRSATVGWRSRDSVGGSVDIGERFGVGQVFGLRMNAAYEHLDPPLRSAKGERTLFALAGDWRLAPDTLLEAEVESSRSSQPSQPGFSLLGSQLPDAKSIDPRTNLNNQPWSLPVVFFGNTGSLRLQTALAAGWKFTAHAMRQQLRSDDRLAYPFGCSAENNYDRYCSNGSFDFYDFRSDNERRRTDALNLMLEGRADTGSVQHHISTGVLASRFTLRTHPRVDDGTVVGTGTIDGLTVVPPSALAALGTVPNTDRTERNIELSLRDRLVFNPQTSAWLGLRYTRTRQESIKNDGTQSVNYPQSFLTPWLALSREVAAGHTVYASWGQGIETAVTPNKTAYGDQAGQPLPGLRSRQAEVGYKARVTDKLSYALTAFQITKPVPLDTGSTYTLDGTERHRGLQAEGSWDWQAWRFDTSAMLLNAKRLNSSDPTIDGKRPTNVPSQTLKAQARWRVVEVSGLSLLAGVVHEGGRIVTPDNTISIPGWTRLDLGLTQTHKVGGTQLTWRAGVDNATDHRAWRESPYQYGHVYLYPLAPRTWRLSLQADL